MRSFHNLVCFLCLTAPLAGCNILSGNQLTVDYTFIANGESRAVPLNVDGETVGTTGEPVKVANKNFALTFGNPGSLKTTDAFSVPIVTLDDGTKWIHGPVDITVGGSSARTGADTAGDMSLDSATPDTGAPAVNNGAIIGTAIGSYMAEGPWTCSGGNSEPMTTDVTYPDASSVSMPIFGVLQIKDLQLSRPTDGISWVGGEISTLIFTPPRPNVPIALINVVFEDGSDGLNYNCWAGTEADNPWLPQ